MSNELIIALIGSGTSLLIALLSWATVIRKERRDQVIERLTSRIERLRKDGAARVAIEKTACDWIAELKGSTPLSIQRDLRDRTQRNSGLRPKLSPSDYELDTKASK